VVRLLVVESATWRAWALRDGGTITAGSSFTAPTAPASFHCARFAAPSMEVRSVARRTVSPPSVPWHRDRAGAAAVGM
jgi:hypothetical protein